MASPSFWEALGSALQNSGATLNRLNLEQRQQQQQDFENSLQSRRLQDEEDQRQYAILKNAITGADPSQQIDPGMMPLLKKYHLDTLLTSQPLQVPAKAKALQAPAPDASQLGTPVTSLSVPNNPNAPLQPTLSDASPLASLAVAAQKDTPSTDVPLPQAPAGPVGDNVASVSVPQNAFGMFRRQTPEEALNDTRAALTKQAYEAFLNGSQGAPAPSGTPSNSVGPLGIPTQSGQPGSQQTVDGRTRALTTLALGKPVTDELYGPNKGTPADQGPIGSIVIPGVDPNATGEDVIKNLPVAAQNAVRDVVNYRYKLPSMGTALKDPQYKALLQLAMQYDPNFQAQNYDKIQAGLKAFSSGRQGDMLTSANKAMNHLAQLSDAEQGLGNREGLPGATIWNSVANAVEGSKGNFSALNRYNATVNGLSDELAKFFSGRGGVLADANHWKQVFSSSQGPQGLKGAIDGAMQLMAGQLDPLKQQFQNATGLPAQWSLLSPEARQSLAKLGYDPSQIDPGQEGGPFAPPQTKSPEDNSGPNLPSGSPTVGQAAQAAGQKTVTVAEVNTRAKQMGVAPTSLLAQLKAAGYVVTQ